MKKKTKFTVAYRMVCNGSVTVEAESLKKAIEKIQNLPASKLGKEAGDVDVEIVSDEED